MLCQGSAAQAGTVVVQELLQAGLVLQLLMLHTQSCCAEFHGAAVAFPVLQHGLLAALVCSPALGITSLSSLCVAMQWKCWARSDAEGRAARQVVSQKSSISFVSLCICYIWSFFIL